MTLIANVRAHTNVGEHLANIVEASAGQANVMRVVSLALVIASLGLYGLLAQTVSARGREIGIRGDPDVPFADPDLGPRRPTRGTRGWRRCRGVGRSHRR